MKYDYRKSTHSQVDGDDALDTCVEVGGDGKSVRMRDTKDRERGHLTFTPGAWMALIRSAKKTM